MPNWCENHLNVEGPGTDQFFEACRGYEETYEAVDMTLPRSELDKQKTEVEFTFNALHPVPKEVVKVGYSARNNSQGLIDGYNWQIQNWGTKWDIAGAGYDMSVEEDSGFINFDTAWGPPIAWVECVAQQFPNLEFTLEYFEPGMAFAGRLVSHGEDIMQDQYDWSQDPEGYKKFVAEDLEDGWDYFEDEEEETE